MKGFRLETFPRLDIDFSAPLCLFRRTARCFEFSFRPSLHHSVSSLSQSVHPVSPPTQPVNTHPASQHPASQHPASQHPASTLRQATQTFHQDRIFKYIAKLARSLTLNERRSHRRRRQATFEVAYLRRRNLMKENFSLFK